MVKSKKSNSLGVYKSKRDFSVTPEPTGKKKKKEKEPLFVIQKHDASHLHYDFRIEVDGVLKSWAVPKGPSLNPQDKRLAVPTEDHPYDYAYFEGIIPQGEYGGGTVMVWDIGTYRNIKEKDGKLVPLKKCLEQGTVEIVLEGKKLQGAFALIRTGKPEDKRWLLIKMKDEYASARKNPVKSAQKSALTDRTTNQIKKEES